MNLSICMMVKNEEKNLYRCLKSIVELTKKLSCEIIVVDTGSTDKTIEIAKKYTDKIFIHPWENNFSKMRNISIGYATGDWIFILDADEEIENCNSLVEFIKSSANKNYKSGFCSLKNIGTNEDYSSTIFTPRLFRKGEISYEGVVHNQPIFNTPIADLNTTIFHYGYINSDKELMEKKFNRTSNMLIEQLNRDPENIYYRFQLSVSYSMHGDSQMAYDEILKAYEKIKYNNDNTPIYVYQQMAVCGININKFEKVKEVCINGIKLEPNFIDLYFYLAQAESILKNYDKAIEASKQYLKILRMFNNNEIKVNSSLTLYTLDSSDTIYNNLAIMCKKLHIMNEAVYYAKFIKNEANLKAFIKIIIDYYIEMKNYFDLKNYYEDVIKNQSSEVINLFRSILENKKILVSDDEKLLIENSFSCDDEYGLLNKIRYSFKNDQENTSELLTTFLSKYNLNNLSNYYGDILYVAFSKNIKALRYIKNISDENLIVYLNYISTYYKNFNEVLIKSINNLHTENIHDIKLKMLFEMYYLENYSNNFFQYENIFNDYIESGMCLIETTYGKQNLLNEKIAQVDSNEKAYFIYRYLAYNRYSYDKEIFNKYINMANEIYPNITLITDKIQTFKKNSKEKELENYQIQVKNTIRNLIINEDLSNAEAIIKEYESIVNNDVEIVLFKSQIALKKMELMNDSQYKM